MPNNVIDNTNVQHLVSDIKAKADLDYWKSSDTEEINLATVATSGSYNDLTDKPTAANGALVYVGTCATAAATATKTCTVETFPTVNGLPVAGTVIAVKFTNSNTAASPKLNVNSTGAQSIYYNASVATSTGTSYAGYANRYAYYMWDGTNWCWLSQGTDLNDNTVGYTVRTNATRKTVDGDCYRYRILFTSADGKKWVPSNTSTSTSATASKTVNQTKIDPWGPIAYYAYTTALSSGSAPSASYLYQQYASPTLGYSFNRTGNALTLTTQTPVWIKCAPQNDGSAIIDATTPYVQALPSTADGKIYILLGNAITATTMELLVTHPVYYHDGTALRMWTGPVSASSGVTDVTVGGTSVVTNGVAAVPAIPTVPDISTDISADASSDDKTASPQAVKTFVEGKGYTTNTGTVTGVTAGAGLNTTSNDAGTDGGTISTSGTLHLTKSGVTAGTYQGLTVDKYGRVTAASNQNYGTYSKPSGGIPATDMTSEVQTSLGKADTALQSFTEADPVFTASAAYGISSSDITTWNGKQEALVSGTNIKTINNQSILGNGNLTINGGVTDVTVDGDSIVTNGVAELETESVSAIDLETPIETSYPSGGFRSNKIYDLGSQTGTITYALYTTGLDTTIKNEWVWSFTTGSTAPQITWPSPTGMKWDGGSAPTINASCLYEISIRLIGSYYVGYYKEIEL